nr:hypothetical protein [Tanacetum cinerariifolium]
MSNTNNNLQTQTSNALHNAIMEASGKDRPSMLAPGSSETTIEGFMENYKNVSQDIWNQLDVEAKAFQIILTRIDNDIYSTVDACPNACEMWKSIKRLKQATTSLPSSKPSYSLHLKFLNKPQQAATRNKGKAIVNSPKPTYDQEPAMVAGDDEMSKEKEIDKLMALISPSFNKIYKPTTNNLKTSSNINSFDMSNNRLEADQDEDEDLAKECDFLVSLIKKLKCEINENKDHNKLLESSNKTLVDKLKHEIEDFKNKNKCLESSNNHFKEANSELAKNKQLMFKDLKKFQAELDRYNDLNYASKVELIVQNLEGN